MTRLLAGIAGLLIAGLSLAATDFSALPDPVRSLLAPAQSLWSQLDAGSRRDLQAQARDWLARSPPEREALRTRIRAWDQLPAGERAARRAAHAAWRGLGADERAQVRTLAQEFSALPPEQQQLLRMRFAQQPYDAQRSWQHGPAFGAQLAVLAPMFAYVPEAERAGVFALLRGLEASARADLALLMPRLDNAGRDRLRHDLQSAAPAARANLIRRRLDRQ